MSSTDEVGAMRRAIALSALGLGTTSPNPPVGCVVLDSAGRPVGEGYHRRKGESHAEVHALVAAGDRARGGTAVVTLEPCNHFGRTPPCHQALIDAGVARVVVAVIDPTSRGAGGVARLRAAGVDVQVGLLEDEALVVLGPWLGALRMGRPRVTWACGGDGFALLPDAVVSELRFRVDAVVGADGRVEEGVPGSHGVDVLTLPTTVPTAEPTVALAALYDAGARMVLLHGGQELAGPFVAGRVVDEVVAMVEPSHDADSSLAGFGFKSVRKLDGGVLVTMTA